MSYPNEMIYMYRGKIGQVFPEMKDFLDRMDEGCPHCRKKQVSGAILTKIQSLAKDGRDLSRLRGVFPENFFDGARD